MGGMGFAVAEGISISILGGLTWECRVGSLTDPKQKFSSRSGSHKMPSMSSGKQTSLKNCVLGLFVTFHRVYLSTFELNVCIFLWFLLLFK